MKRVVPDYYADFACIAGACRHTCCVGWEIDIDPDSLRRYRAMPGEMGERLRSYIDIEETPHFRLTADERCPLLNTKHCVRPRGNRIRAVLRGRRKPDIKEKAACPAADI